MKFRDNFQTEMNLTECYTLNTNSYNSVKSIMLTLQHGSRANFRDDRKHHSACDSENFL